jgi:hypothetical protein
VITLSKESKKSAPRLNSYIGEPGSLRSLFKEVPNVQSTLSLCNVIVFYRNLTDSLQQPVNGGHDVYM